MPSYSQLIDTHQLSELIKSGPFPAIFDCRFDLTATTIGEVRYREGHLPGARFLNLDRDLSGAKNGLNGRHPLPERENFVARLRELGLNRGQQVVVYDDQDGMFAARAWWLLRWLGHSKVAVLDGGLSAWQAAGNSLDTNAPLVSIGDFESATSGVATVEREEILSNLVNGGQFTIIDARAPDRFAGENESIDARAGHIPGAFNRFFRKNLDPSGRFKSAEDLRNEFRGLLGDRLESTVVHQCGSGVTACHNLLAMEIAGISKTKLYPGSWSEWSSYSMSPIDMGS